MNYTEQANSVLQIAKKTAKDLNHPYVGTEHLLLGLSCGTDFGHEWCG